MKKITLINMLAWVVLVVTSCDNRQAEVQSLTNRGDSLEAIINGRDSALNDFINSFNEIEANLASVAKKQNVITEKIDGRNGELKQTSKDRINKEIADINSLMDENRAKIAQLNKKLKSSGGKIAKFEEMIQTLNAQLAQKDAELVVMNDKLNSLNTQIADLNSSLDTLNTVNAAQAADITSKVTALHTAYYIVGKSKELQDEKVIDRTGGLLGIGKTPKLSSDFDNSRFTQIDYTKITSIPINSDDPKIVTTHPKNSFTLEKKSDDQSVLTISDPEKFWSASKYLVVVAQ
ncbi:MAG: hypothetical protein IPP27_04850 [Bacteroidetes bacterium]|nr:hypothetical protein [Bacteroidota bacterium]